MVRSHSIPGRAQSRRIAVSVLALALTVALGHAHSQPAQAVTAPVVGPVTGHAPVVVIESVANRTVPNHAPAVGHTVRATVKATDPDDDTITSTTYRWKRGGVEIGTGTDYTATSADAGQTLTLEVEASTDPAITEPYLGFASTTVGVGGHLPDIINLTIAGNWAVDEKLTANFELVDADGDLIDEAGMRYQWHIDDRSAQRLPVAVPGATGRTFVLRPEDAGDDRIVWFSVEKARTLTGDPNERLRPTSPTGAWQVKRPGTIFGHAPVAHPSFLRQGNVLKGSVGYTDAENDPEGTHSYQWYRATDRDGNDRTPIAGATQINYTLQAADGNHYMVFEVIPRSASGEPREGVAARVVSVDKLPGTPPVANPSITGTVSHGQTLTGVVGYQDAENDPEGTHTYQWYRATDAAGTNRTPIAGATNVTYAIQAADANHYLVFEVIPHAASGEPTQGVAARAVTSGSVPPMIEDVPVAYDLGYSGLLSPGETLTSDFKYRNVPGGPGPGTHTYQWFTATSRSAANITDIPGANGVTYTLTPADSGRYIGFRVTPRSTAGGVGQPAGWMRGAEVVYRSNGPWPLNSNTTISIPMPVTNRTGNAPSNLSVRFARGCHWLIQDGWNPINSVTLVAPDGSKYPLGSGGEPCGNASWRVNVSSESANGTWRMEFHHTAPPGYKVAMIDWISLGFDEP